jgi:cell division protease FtsH
LYCKINTQGLDGDRILFRYEAKLLVIEIFKEKKIIATFTETLLLKLDKLRENRSDDIQAITAVHEAGHAVLSIALLNTIPEYIFSITAMADSHGFTRVKNDTNYQAKHMIAKMAAVYLGGMAAEVLVFGEDNKTSGASEDINQATTYVLNMLKTCGMGSTLTHVEVEGVFNNLSVFDHGYKINQEGEQLIKGAYDLATETLTQHKPLLLKIADILSDKQKINKEEINELLKESAPLLFEKLNLKGNNKLIYRETLKKMVASEGRQKEVMSAERSEHKPHVYSLNANSQQERSN